MNAPELILASASPRRSALLKQAQLEFRVVPSEAQELCEPQLTARELAQGNAYRKARLVAEAYAAAVVLGADTDDALALRSVADTSPLHAAGLPT